MAGVVMHRSNLTRIPAIALAHKQWCDAMTYTMI
jgi:hypothetical protein